MLNTQHIAHLYYTWPHTAYFTSDWTVASASTFSAPSSQTAPQPSTLRSASGKMRSHCCTKGVPARLLRVSASASTFHLDVGGVQASPPASEVAPEAVAAAAAVPEGGEEAAAAEAVAALSCSTGARAPRLPHTIAVTSPRWAWWAEKSLHMCPRL